MPLEFIGWLGSASLAFCAIPQLIHTVRTKDATGLSWGFLGLWGGGEVLALIYQHAINGWTPLHFNYIMNIAIISVLGMVKYD
jgi:uncharacterized protein with PQ loop repeat